MKRKLCALLLALGMIVSFAAAAGAAAFADVPGGSWYAAGVSLAAEKGIMTGTGGTTFSPRRPVSWAQDITALLATLADKAAAAGKEFINIFYGADISEADAEQALALFQQHAPDAEVNLVSGGQPIYYYLISAE